MPNVHAHFGAVCDGMRCFSSPTTSPAHDEGADRDYLMVSEQLSDPEAEGQCIVDDDEEVEDFDDDDDDDDSCRFGSMTITLAQLSALSSFLGTIQVASGSLLCYQPVSQGLFCLVIQGSPWNVDNAKLMLENILCSDAESVGQAQQQQWTMTLSQQWQ